MRTIIALLGLILALPIAAAQTPDPSAPAAQPVIEVSLDPPSVLVGRPVRIRVRALAPNYLTKPAEFPDLQMSNAVTRPAGQTSISDRRGGVTYAGVMADYEIYPQEPGRFETPAAVVTLGYAAAPPASTTVHLAMPKLGFIATVPDAARDLRPFLATSRLTLSQVLAPASGPFKVGDALKRTITVEAEDLPAIFIPALPLAGGEGVASYPGQPVVQDVAGQRGEPSRGRRVETVTYVFERAGDITLPAAGFGWWNSRTGRVEEAATPAIPLHVAPGMPVSGEGAGRPLLQSLVIGLREHGLASLAGLVVLGLAWAFGPRLAKRLAPSFAARQAARLGSEAHAYRALKRACRHGPARDIYAALLVWLDRAGLSSGAGTSRGPDDALRRELRLLEAVLFGGGRCNGSFDPWDLLRAVRAARGRSSAPDRGGMDLPATLNPPAGRIG